MPRRDVTLHSVTTGETATFSAPPQVERGEPAWSNYVRGVIAGFQQRGKSVGGFDAVIDSTLPMAAGWPAAPRWKSPPPRCWKR